MISFKKIRQALNGGPEFIDQDMFDLNVISTYKLRSEFNSFDDFWFGEIHLNSPKETKKITDILFRDTFSDYSRDKLLGSQYGNASIKLENYLMDKYKLSEDMWFYFRKLTSYALDYDSFGNLKKTSGMLFADSHREPSKRVDIFMENFKRYELLIFNKD